MRHTRHYTLEQATAAREWVTERVIEARHARAELVALGPRARAALAELDTASGGAYPGRVLAAPLVRLARAMSELTAVDIVLRDIDRGLIDFPAIAPDGSGAVHDCGPQCPARGTPDGEEIYLCWLLDEDAIRFWHEPDAGFAGRRPL